MGSYLEPLKKAALINLNKPYLIKIRAYESHIATLQKFCSGSITEGFQIDADKVKFDPWNNEEFLQYHALAQAGGIKPEQLQALIAACPPVTFISADLLTDEQIEHYIEKAESGHYITD